MCKQLIFVINDLGFFVSHRLPVALMAKKKGFDVRVAYGEKGKGIPSKLVDLGIEPIKISMPRGGTNPFLEILSLFEIWKLFRRLKPDLVHLVTIKPYIYGGIAARLAGVPAVVSAVSGLGSMFERKDLKRRLFRNFLYPFFRYAFNHKNQIIIVQNQDDGIKLVQLGLLPPVKIRLLRGSGVDLLKFNCKVELRGQIVISFVGRLLRDKGVFEFVEAARLLRLRGLNLRCWLIGDADPGNPTSVNHHDLGVWNSADYVEVFGFRKDIPELFLKSHIICLPSYREGLPKALIEAAAAGRAVVTTNVPGCRDAIINGETGVLVPVKDAKKLADALQGLVLHPQERIAMGKAGRLLAEQNFAVEKIVEAHLKIYKEVLK